MSTPAPVLAVSGNTITWKPLPGISSYVFVRKVPGQRDEYSIVKGTSITPPAVPGATVHYGLRANVTNSPWAKEVAISYPLVPPAPLPPVPPVPPAPPAPAPGVFPFGIVVGSAILWELRFAQEIGARTARMEFEIGASVATLEPIIDAYARAGIRPHLLAGFYGRLPTAAEAQNLGAWAAAFGPGGTFWAGKSYAAAGEVHNIEFGNETSYSYQWSDNSSATYASRARSYGSMFSTAQAAVKAANPNVGLLAIADGMDPRAWCAGMVAAAPLAIANAADGFTLHPYGSSWKARVDGTIAALAAVGITDLEDRLFVTEWGLASDNGRLLSDNYGWNPAMTYDEAASTLLYVLGELRATYGSRMGAFFLYSANDLYATGTRTGREAYFGALQSGGQPKGAYTSAVEAQTAL